MGSVIGLTGSIATGKSTVASILKEHCIPVIDADKIAREIVEPNEPTYKEIIQVFGSGILQDDGRLNRKKLGALIFSNKNMRKQLNQIMHPAIRKKMIEKRDMHIHAGAKSVVLDIPLLFESKLTALVEKILVVSVDESVQLERLMKRNNYSEEDAIQRIRAQIPIKEKAELADEIIDNNGSKRDTKRQVERVIKDWKMK